MISRHYSILSGHEASWKVDTAPLCRRAHIVLDHKLKNNSVSICDFLVMMLNNDIDPATSEAFSAWKVDQKNFNYLRIKN